MPGKPYRLLCNYQRDGHLHPAGSVLELADDELENLGGMYAEPPPAWRRRAGKKKRSSSGEKR